MKVLCDYGRGGGVEVALGFSNGFFLFVMLSLQNPMALHTSASSLFEGAFL